MNKKALSLAITLAMAFPAASHALGLGDIQSNSHLNQPFKGKIPVLSATPAEAKNIRVKIASPAVFNRVGIDRPAFLNSIRFRSVIENGKPVILVSSTQPIHEPFVNFLLEVNWPKGQLLKEYTALLDPPVLMQPGTAVASNRVGVRAEPGAQRRINRPAAQQPRRAQAQRRIVRAPAPQARRAAPPRQRPLTELQRGAQALGLAGNRTAARATPARGTKTYRVKRGDYLYKVAKKLGYRGVRTEQMMMALYEANPQAFDSSNVNKLKAGALMRRPTVAQAKGITYRTARKQLASHTKAWKQTQTRVAGKATSKTQVAKNTQSNTPSNSNNQARMVVSGSDGAKVNGSNAAAGNASVAELKQKLVLASESLTARTNENSELKSRVAELESLLRKKNRLITLKSEQLAELQANVGGADVTPAGEPETEVVKAGVEEPISTEVNGGEGADIQAQVANQNANANGEIIRTSEPEVAPEPEVVEAVTPTQPVRKPESEDAGILGLLGDPMVTGIGGGSLLALLGGLWFMRRRKNSADGDDDEYTDFALDQELAQGVPEGDDLDLGLDQTQLGGDEFTEADFGIEESMFPDQATQAVDAKPEEEESVESKEENILQEADVYLVYGLHDQAEAELRKAIEEEPNNLAYRAKLIENFKAAGDKKGFETEVKAFKQMDGPNKEKLWNDITGWGKSFIPDSNLFTAKSAAVAGAVTAAAAGIAITAGKASPEENVDVDFSDEVENLIETDELENLDNILDDDFSIDIDDMLDDSVSDDVISNEVTNGLDLNTDLVMDDVIEGDISDSFEMGSDDLSASVDSLDLENDLDISNFETDLGTDLNLDDKISLTSETESIDDVVDGLDLDFDLGLDDSIENMTETVTDKVEGKLEMPNLNLDIDAKDFDKIMPENHAYKKVESVVEGAEDNLLADFDDNLSFLDLDDSGEVIEETQIGTKLDLAKAYIDMGDIEGARSTLEEVMMEGNDEQKKEAEELLHQTG